MTPMQKKRAAETEEMKALHAHGVKQKDIAEHYGLSLSAVRGRLGLRAYADHKIIIYLARQDKLDVEAHAKARGLTISALGKVMVLTALEEGLFPLLLGEV